MPYVGSEPRRSFASNAWVVSGHRSASGAPLLAADPHRRLANPPLRYLVHLSAPGWNVIGATAPWLPGVVIGHNERVAWGITSFAADVQDVYVERLNPGNRHQIEHRGEWRSTTVVRESVWVKGRSEPVTFEREHTPHGVIVAVDGEKHLAFTVRWSGTEPGTTGELGALALDRANSVTEVRAALSGWKLPAAEFVYADRDGNVGSQVAALVPKRRGWNGAFPVPGWTGGFEWDGWPTLDELPHVENPAREHLVSANGNVARTRRLDEVLASAPRSSVDDFKTLQHDVLAWNAQRLLPLLSRVRAERADVERARDALVVDALGAAVDDMADRVGSSTAPSWGRLHTVTFEHVLAVTQAARRRFNVGPFEIGGYPHTVMAMSDIGMPATGASFRAIFDLADWHRSVAQNAPGQSGSPASAHAADVAKLWAAGKYFPLVFSDAAVRANTEATLTLVPVRLKPDTTLWQR